MRDFSLALSMARTLIHKGCQASYDVIIGVDHIGLWIATFAGQRLNTPVVYFSLELYTPTNPVQQVVKFAERKCNQRAAFTVVQSTERARHLQRYNRINTDSIVLVPNSPLGDAEYRRTDYLRRRLDIHPKQKIVLQIGAIADTSLNQELAGSLILWPNDLAMVMHGSTRRDDDPYLATLRSVAGQGKLYLSTERVSYDQLDEVVASADIGLALYANIDPNWYYIAFASGKLAQYLKVGLPIITVDFPDLRAVCEKYRCGLTVADVQEIPEAVRIIMANYGEYSENAVRCFQEAYHFERHFESVLHRLNQLSRARDLPLAKRKIA